MPLDDAPLTIPSKRSPMRPNSSAAATELSRVFGALNRSAFDRAWAYWTPGVYFLSRRNPW